jgi:hypothetical protein
MNKVIPQFTSLMCSFKTARKAKTRKTKINFPLLLDGNNDRFRERKLENWKIGINLCISFKRKLVNRLLVYRGITVVRS